MGSGLSQWTLTLALCGYDDGVTLLPRLRQHLRSLSLLVMPALVVFILARQGATHSSGTLLVLGEPIILTLGLYAAAACALHRHWRASAATLLALCTGAIAMNLPVDLPIQRAVVPDWLRPLRGCAILPQDVQAPVRIATWTVDPSMPMEETLTDIAAQRPDLVVLLGTDDPEIGTALSETLNGEVMFFQGGGGVIAAVRGSFQYCGEKTDRWTVNLPGSESSNAQVMLTFPHIEHVGVLPMMIVRTDTPRGPTDLPAWADRLADEVGMVAAAAHAIGPRRMLVVGNFHAPVRAQTLSQPMRTSGLRPVSTPPNWPTRLGGLPFLPVHALDQLWAGRGWRAQRARVIPSGTQLREPIMVDFTPIEAQAR